jgi:hypothetical protein
MSNTHVIQHWVGGVPASANMDDWVSAEMSTGKPLLDCVSAAALHYYRLSDSSLSEHEKEIIQFMLQSIRVYDLMWADLKREESV